MSPFRLIRTPETELIIIDIKCRDPISYEAADLAYWRPGRTDYHRVAYFIEKFQRPPPPEAEVVVQADTDEEVEILEDPVPEPVANPVAHRPAVTRGLLRPMAALYTNPPNSPARDLGDS